MILTRTHTTIERLIRTIDDTDKLIDCINCLIGNYYKNAEALTGKETDDLFDLEQSKRFFMYLKKEL